MVVQNEFGMNGAGGETVGVKKEPIDFVDPKCEKSDKTVKSQRPSFANYPKGVFFCLGNEFAERFSFYGMRAILTIYLITIHQMHDHEAKLIYHAFISLAYFTPILGSILADGFLGRYRVILYISILYVFGHVLLTIGAVPDLGTEVLKVLDFVGLLVIAVATGGIKPCVSSFAADQFPPDMLAERKQFFSFFYFTINLGALLSKVVTPYARTTKCLGQDSCFPLAFGIPAVFMLLALIIFVCGKPFYKIVKCQDNVIWKVCKCVAHAMGKCLRAPKRSWLDYSVPRFGAQLVGDIRVMLSVCVLFLPVIPFWGLFDQLGSTWVIQANRMDGRLGYLTVLPEQMSVLNPLLVILLVPVFEMFLYPFLAKFQILIKPLRRMGWGGILAAVSFAMAGLLQLAVNKTLVTVPTDGTVRYVLVNRGQCPIIVDTNEPDRVSVASDENLVSHFAPGAFVKAINCSKQYSDSILNHTDNTVGHLITFWASDTSDTDNKGYINFDLKKTPSGKSRIYIELHPDLLSFNNTIYAYQNQVNKFSNEKTNHYLDLQPSLISSTDYQIVLESCNRDADCKRYQLYDFRAQMGGAHVLVINENRTADLIELIKPNSLSLMWQVPQYVVMTVGEILLSISGLEFSYAQAPPSMKSVLQAVWLLTAAFGNILDMIISGSHTIDDPATEFFVYAVLMLIVMIIFVFLAYRYKPVQRELGQTPADNNSSDTDNKKPVIKSNSLDFVRNEKREEETTA